MARPRTTLRAEVKRCVTTEANGLKTNKYSIKTELKEELTQGVRDGF